MSTMDTTVVPAQGGRIPASTVATRVRDARLECKLSQREAAEQCELTFGEWQSIEAGRKAGQLDVKIDRIARGLGYDRNWLMWGGGDRTSRVLGEQFVPFQIAS